MPNKQDSNLTGLAIIEEASLGVLPAAASQHWLALEPNGYPDFGNSVTKVARETINPTRKRLKGGTTDVDASGGFEHDLVPNWLVRVIRGFFLTDGDESSSSDHLTIADNGTQIAATTVDDTFTVDSALTVAPLVDMLVFADGFTNAANNGLHLVTGVPSSTTVPVTTNLTDEIGGTSARLRVCGFQFTAGDLTVTASGDTLIITNGGTAFTSMNIHPGDTIFIGGDAAGTQFDTLGTGYARVVSVTATTLLLKDFTGTPASDDDTGKTIQIFFPWVGFRDELAYANIVRRSYQFERTLGEDDTPGTQAEYIKGCVPSTMELSLEEASKITVSFGYVGLDRETIDGTGTIKTEVAGATLWAAEAEEFFNTSTDIHTARLVKDVGQTSLVGYIQNLSVTVDNGFSPNKAVGVVGAFDFSAGDFSVDGSVNAYFDTVAAMDAIRDNDDVSLQLIGARDNQGFAIALPLCTLSGGQAQVTPDEPIMLPLELMAAGATAVDGSTSGLVTMAYNVFAYLPTVAMPTS